MLVFNQLWKKERVWVWMTIVCSENRCLNFENKEMCVNFNQDFLVFTKSMV